MNSNFHKKEFNFNREMKAKEQIELVNGDELLVELVETVKKYIVADEDIIIVAILWCILTWCMDIVYYAPILHITSSEKQSGKTRFLNIIKGLSYKPAIVSGFTYAALFRQISEHQNTLFFDQSEKKILKHKKLKDIFVDGAINDGRSMTCCVGKNNDPKSYFLWGAKAICSLGALPKEITAVSIVLPIRRKLKTERIINIVSSNSEVWNKLTSKIASFVEGNKEMIATIDVPYVEELTDTMNDYWSSLFKIALTVNVNWFERLKKAAITLTGEDETKINKIELLTAIKTTFDDKRIETIDSKSLCAILNKQPFYLKISDTGKELTPRGLADLLKEFGISSNTVTLNDGKKLKGYKLKQFTDVFNKYLQDD